jgi:hypothetical protein
LQKYRDEEKKNLENEQKKKGKYIELIENKDKEILELNKSILDLKEKASAWDSFQEEQKANLEKEYTELTAKIDKNILEKNNFILEDLNLEKKV